MKKLKILCGCILFVLLTLTICMLTGYIMQIKSENKPIIKGYNKKEVLCDETDNGYHYFRYYYSKEFDTLYIENNQYHRIFEMEEQKLDKIKKIIISHPYNQYENLDESDSGSFINKLFAANNLLYYTDETNNDEVKLYLYIYDVENHILHFIKIID